MKCLKTPNWFFFGKKEYLIMGALQRLTLNEKLAENSEFLAEKYPSDENFINFMTKRFHFATKSIEYTNSTVNFSSDIIPTKNGYLPK